MSVSAASWLRFEASDSESQTHLLIKEPEMLVTHFSQTWAGSCLLADYTELDNYNSVPQVAEIPEAVR